MLMEVSELSSVPFLECLGLGRDGGEGLAGGKGLRTFLGIDREGGGERVEGGLWAGCHDLGS
jgi:hypothetical protein